MGNVITVNSLYTAKLANLLAMANLRAYATGVQADGTCSLVLADGQTGRVYRLLDSYLTAAAAGTGSCILDNGIVCYAADKVKITALVDSLLGVSLPVENWVRVSPIGADGILQHSTFHLVGQLLELLTRKIYY